MVCNRSRRQNIAVDLKTPQLVRPNTMLRVPVKLANLAGEEARIVVAAVDVGILNSRTTNRRRPMTIISASAS